MQKAALEEIYRNHHERGKRYGYLYCHGGRAPYLKQWIGTGKRVLDLGCRDGMLTQTFAFGNEIVGADIDSKALELIRRRLNIETHWVDLNAEWPFPPHSFDVVVACEIIEHLFFLDQFLHRVAATLKPNGLFLGSVPNAFRMRNRLKFLFGHEYEKDPTHVRQFSPKKLEASLSPLFNSISIVPIKGRILPFLPVSPYMPSSLNKLFAQDLLFHSKKKE